MFWSKSDNKSGSKSEVDESTRPRFDITTSATVNLSKYELGKLMEKSSLLRDITFSDKITGTRGGKTVVTRVKGVAPNAQAKLSLEGVLGNTSVV